VAALILFLLLTVWQKTNLDRHEHGFIIRADGSVEMLEGRSGEIQVSLPDSAIIFAHTHPRGSDNYPSPEDIQNEKDWAKKGGGISLVEGVNWKNQRTVYRIDREGKVTLE
jgi:hypothetical protein